MRRFRKKSCPKGGRHFWVVIHYDDKTGKYTWRCGKCKDTEVTD